MIFAINYQLANLHLGLYPFLWLELNVYDNILTCIVPVITESHTGQQCGVDPHAAQRQRCRQGSSSTHDSFSPQPRQSLLGDALLPQPAMAAVWSSSAAPCLPQQDSASSSSAAAAEQKWWRSPVAWATARTCWRSLLREFAAASLICARPRSSWFSTQRVFILSCRAKFSFSTLRTSSSFSDVARTTRCWIAASNSLDCTLTFSSISSLIVSICSFQEII